FPATPMLTIGAAQRFISEGTLTENEAGVLLNIPLATYFENILDLLPDTRNVAVGVGNFPIQKYYAAAMQRELQRFADRAAIEWFNDLSFGEMLTRAAAMPRQSAILWFLLSEDAAGVPYSQDRALETMREVATAPIFGIGDYELGRGIVGGRLMPTHALGQESAEVALRILKGEKAGSINAPTVVAGAPTYDWREL